MRTSKRSVTITIMGLLTFFAFGCVNREKAMVDTKVGNKKEDITLITLNISAAASLRDTMEEIKELYTKKRNDIELVCNFGSSGTLQKQIEQGAEVDIFMPAAAKQMDELECKGLIKKETRKDLLENKVVLITQKGNLSINEFKDLAEEKVSNIALGEPKSVPAGQYAEEALTNLGILDKVKGKAAYGKDVKAVLAWVESGNADVGIVYETDAKASDKVRIIVAASAESHKPIIYPVAVIKDSKSEEAARDFLDFLENDEVRSVFERYGFKVNRR